MPDEPFFMQWHITDDCNLSCRHCYRDEPKADLPEAELLLILDQFSAFLAQHHLRGRINFSGGEPLRRADVLLRLMAEARRRGIRTRVLTNGMLLTRDLAAQLAQARCEAVQISLEGPQDVHDDVRGEGAFDRALEGAGNARLAGLSITFSAAVGQWNWRRLPELAHMAHDYADRLFVHRFVPCGRGDGLAAGMLTAHEWRQVARWCVRESRRDGGLDFPLRDPTFVCFFARRARPKPAVGGGCAVGYEGFAVEANGDVYPCRRLPLVVGNMQTHSLETIWACELMESLRNRDALDGHCGQCDLRWHCGGCRAIAWAVTGSPLAADPQCFYRPPRRALLRPALAEPTPLSSPPACRATSWAPAPRSGTSRCPSRRGRSVGGTRAPRETSGG